MMDKGVSHQAIGSMLLGCILFGLGGVIVAYVPLGAYAVAFWRLTVAGVIFAVLAKIYGHKLLYSADVRKGGLWAGVFLAFDLALWHESIHAVGPGIATLLNSLQIFWLAAIGFIGFGEKLNVAQTVSLLLAIVGIALVGSPEFGRNPNAAWGMVSGVASGLMLALSVLAMRRTQQITPTPIFALMLQISIGGAIALLLPMLLFDNNQILPHNATQIGFLLLYGILGQCVAWELIAYAVPLLRLSLAGLLLLSEPVAALLIDFAFLDKAIGLVQWLGVILTVIAIYAGTLADARQQAT